MKRYWQYAALTLALGTFRVGWASAQSSGQGGAQPAPAAQAAPQAVNPPKGEVLFQSHGEPPAALTEEPLEGQQSGANAQAAADLKPSGPALNDSERAAITFTGYDLDARLTPTTSGLAMRARLTLRNDGAAALTRIALQISSTLHWDGAALLGVSGSTRLAVAQHLLETDADHTGQANEAVLMLPEPLGVGKSLTLDTFYSGTIAASGERLERIGASRKQALAADWDAIGPEGTALRGFGDVLWYPVASPQLFLGEGALLFDAIGKTKLREENATIHLRLAVEYVGDPPVAAYFCGRREALKALSDDANEPVASGSGIATAEFAAEPLGFRMPSLFLVALPETLAAPLPADAGAGAEASAGSAGAPMLAVETEDDAALPALAAAEERAAPLLEEWLGPQPLSALTVIDHEGQPFEEGPLLVAPLAELDAAGAGPATVESLTHAWVQTGRPWMDEGLAQFFALLWTERVEGRETAMKQYAEMLGPLAISEPEFEKGQPAPVGQPLVAATSELYFRRKAAAVWWMLRGIAGDKPLEVALQAWRQRQPGTTSAVEDARAFEALLEKTSGEDLHWFFNDWVLRDRGLPDLSIVDVTPRELPAGKGHSDGWLVAVTVHNDGAAEAQVPVIIRSGTYSVTAQLRVPGFDNATARVLVESPPDDVMVNDGSVPETRTSTHERMIVAHRQ